MTNKPIPEFIWMDGQVVPWKDATLHVWSDALCGINVFEGIRGYWRADTGRQHILHLDRHLERLMLSARAARIPCDHGVDQLAKGIYQLLGALGYREHIYLRPTVLLEHGKYETNRSEIHTRAFVPIFPVPPSADSDLHCVTSTWRRPGDLAVPPRVKAGANYYNLRFARLEATDRGADEPILLGDDGKVAETGGASVFVVRDGCLYTPPVTSSILESITRATVLTLARDALGITAVERPVDRTELYIADEVFLAGTLCEIAPVRTIDTMSVGNGAYPIADDLRAAYQRVCAGDGGYSDWFTPGPATEGRPQATGRTP